MQEQIFSLAQTLSGAGDDERETLEALCSGAEAYWKERLRTPLERCKQSFACAAAFLAAASLNDLHSGGVRSFSAGDVSVQLQGNDGNAGDGLRRAAENLMAPFTKPDGVWLKGVLS